MRTLVYSSLVAGLLAATALVAPVAAATPPDCSLALDVPARNAYGDTVVMHVSGLTGIGGLDVYTRRHRLVYEMHLLLVPGLTEFDFTYQWSPPELPPLPPLEPGHYVVEAVYGFGCVARTTFHVELP
jgi:hypothetical protein